jgi:ATP-binding cassette, subfamily B, bacterial
MEHKKKMKKTRALVNIFYSIRLMWGIKKGAVLQSAIAKALDYIGWVFYSYFFIRYMVGAIQQGESFQHILRFILLSGGFFTIVAFYYSFIEGAYIPLAGPTVYRKLYGMLYKKAGNVELRCFEDSSFYNRYTLAVDGADQKLIQAIQNFFGIIAGGIAAIVVFTAMFTIDRIVVLFILFPIVGNFLFGYLYHKAEYERDKAMAPFKRRIDYVNRVMYMADYSKELRLSKVFNLLKHKYDDALKNIFQVADRYAFKITLPTWIRNYLTFTVMFEGVLMYGAYRAIVGKTMDLAELAVLSSTMVSASWILIRFTESLMESMKQGLFIENLRTFLEYEEKLPENYDGIIPEENIHSIEFRNVSFSYKEDSPVIKNLSFRIEGNNRVALVGHNGAGKTTIIKLLFRLYDPDEGEILLNDINIKEYNLKAYRSLYAAAFQDYKIFALSIKENVLMRECSEEDNSVVIEALAKAGVYDKVRSLPKGIDTIMTKEFDEEGVLLSGGEYQKIVVARAFVKKVPIKVFDEPSSALDPIAEYELYDSIIKDSIDKTMIFISHRLSSVRNADMVYMLENGTILEQGTHKELMEQNGAYADMYNKQAKNYLAVENLQEVIV